MVLSINWEIITKENRRGSGYDLMISKNGFTFSFDFIKKHNLQHTTHILFYSSPEEGHEKKLGFQLLESKTNQNAFALQKTGQ